MAETDLDVDLVNQYPIPPEWESLTFDSTKKAAIPNIGTTDADALKAVLSQDEDDFLPWEETRLPSFGLYYDNKIPEGKVQVRAMNINAEKILATQRLAQSGKALDFLFKHCVRLPNNFDPLDLLLGDRTFLLLYLRGLTYGPEYTFTADCTNEACKRSGVHTFHLNKLRNAIKVADQAYGAEPFRIVLPRMSEVVKRDFWIKVRLMRGRDGIMAKRDADKRKKLDPNQLDEAITKNLSLVVTEVMGSQERRHIDDVISKLHAIDHAYIRDQLEIISPAVDSEVSIPCSFCDNTMKTDLPITEDFFRPPKSVRSHSA